jgi:hypothetical protein
VTLSSKFIYLIVAILLSPILGVFFASVVRDIFLLFTIDFKTWVHNIPAFLISDIAKSMLGLFISLPVVLFYGVPVFYLLKKWEMQNVWMFGLFGLLPTGIAIIVSFFTQSQFPDNLNLYRISLSALNGVFTAMFFWLIAVHIPFRRRSDN